MNNRKRTLTYFLCITLFLIPLCSAFADNADGISDNLPEEFGVEDIVNILLIGTDARMAGVKDDGRADCTMICSLNKDTGAIKLISIERAIYVDIPNVGKDMITNAHFYGGAEYMQEIVEQYFQIELDGYCEVDYQGFINAVDAICGIDIVLTEPEETGLNGLWNELCPENSALTAHEMVEGLNHLDGYDALMYCRLRCIDSDWHRVERQRNMVQAIIDTAKDQTLEHNIDAIKAVLQYTKTNLPAVTIASLLAHVDKFTGAVADQMTVPVKTSPITCDYAVESVRIHNFIYGKGDE